MIHWLLQGGSLYKMRRRMILMKTKTSFTNLTPSQEIEQPCRWTEERGRTRWQSSSLCLLSIFHLRRRIIIITIIIIDRHHHHHQEEDHHHRRREVGLGKVLTVQVPLIG